MRLEIDVPEIPLAFADLLSMSPTTQRHLADLLTRSFAIYLVDQGMNGNAVLEGTFQASVSMSGAIHGDNHVARMLADAGGQLGRDSMPTMRDAVRNQLESFIAKHTARQVELAQYFPPLPIGDRPQT
jgi:hypothetical protein